MSSNKIETNDVNGSQLSEQGPLPGKCSRQGNICHHHTNPVISNRREWTNQKSKIVMQESKIVMQEIKIVMQESKIVMY